jgi:hypothetical protein
MSGSNSVDVGSPPSVDYFATLGLQRHPWVDPLLLKANYHAEASMRHPDQAGGSQSLFILLGEAVACLRKPHSRLRHLVELEFPDNTKPITTRPDTDLFQTVANSLESVRLIEQELRRTTTKLSRSAALAKMAKWVPAVEKQLAVVKSKRDEQDQLCRDAGMHWALRGPEFWKQEASRARYYAKWQSELEEALFACRTPLSNPE